MYHMRFHTSHLDRPFLSLLASHLSATHPTNSDLPEYHLVTTPARNEASRLLDLGYHVIPLQYKSKSPGYPNWQNLLLGPDRHDEQFPPDKQFNLGILLGTEVSDGVFLHAVDVDSDDEQILLRVRHALPPCPQKRGLKGFTAFVSRHESNTKKVFRLKAPLKGQIEVLGKGQQTVLPPSLHPDTHDEYVWLTNPLPAPGSLNFIDSSHLDELGLIAADPEAKVFLLNEMQWLGPNKGGNVDDTVLHVSAYLVSRGWTDDQIVARIRLATRRMLRDNPVKDQWDEALFEKRLLNVIESARAKGYDLPKKKRNPSRAERRVDAVYSFAELHGGYASFWNDAGTLRNYKDGIWAAIPNEVLTHMIFNHIIPMGGFDGSDIDACVKLLKAGARQYERKVGHMVACENGALDLRTGILHPFDPDHYLVAKLPFAHDPNATCPTYDAFVRDMLSREEDEELDIPAPTPDELEASVAAFNEFIGLSLVPDNTFRKALILIGPTSSGKSTVQKLMASFFPRSAVSAVSMSKIQDQRYAYSLKDTLINMTSEMGHDTYVDEETFKNMISGDEMEFRRLNEQSSLSACRARFFIACNSMFKTRDSSGAMEERLIILRTRGPVPPEQRDRLLLEKLMDERQGILNRLMLAYRDLRKRGKFDPPRYQRKELAAFTSDNRPVMQWIEERTHEGQKRLDASHEYTIGRGTPSSELYSDYLQWAQANGMKPMSSVTWGKECKNLGYPGKMKRMGGVLMRARDLHLLQGKNSF
jgi:P4 family phage/plasmid primase-like protien